MGHYKVMLDGIRQNQPTLAEITLAISQTSLVASYPLTRWRVADQVMIEKGKGIYIENLRIIQLVEVDLNFILHVIWGHRHAHDYNLFYTIQYAIPGKTCNNAVWNKLLFLDLSRQTLSPGIMKDYDAASALDRVLIGLTIVTCERMGLHRHASMFMYHPLKRMNFHLITGFGTLIASFSNDDNPQQIGQGVLQGSSSAALIFNLTSDVSLSAYRILGKGTAFTHPITGASFQDMTVQYVDDKNQFLNHLGADISIEQDRENNFISLHNQACAIQKRGPTFYDSWGLTKFQQMLCVFLPSSDKFFYKKIKVSSLPTPPISIKHPQGKSSCNINFVSPQTENTRWE